MLGLLKARPGSASTHRARAGRGKAAVTFAARLRVDHVSRRYGESFALNDVSLDVEPSKVLCLLGPSGCGKTTLLRIIAGVERPTGGSILIDGAEVAGAHRFVPPEKRGVGLMFQDFALFPHLTILGNVAFGLRSLTKQQAQAEAQAALERVGLGYYAHEYPHILSGGQQQRVALARAIAPRPGVVTGGDVIIDLSRPRWARMSLALLAGVMTKSPSTSASSNNVLARLRAALGVAAALSFGLVAGACDVDDVDGVDARDGVAAFEADLEDIDLVVHDWGGAIGFGAAARMPERFERFVVFNTAVFMGPIPWALKLVHVPVVGSVLVRGLNGFVRGGLAVSIADRKRMRNGVGKGYLAPYNSWRTRVANHRMVLDIPVDEKHPTWKPLHAIDASLAQYRDKPMLIVWGEQDFVFTNWFRDQWVKRFPDAEVHSLPECSHWIVEDAHERIVPWMADFLERNPLP